MGFNTTVVIYNDALEGIKGDKNFGKQLYDAIMANYKSKRTESVYCEHGFAGSQTAGVVVEQHHANFDVTIVVGGNTGIIKEKQNDNM